MARKDICLRFSNPMLMVDSAPHLHRNVRNFYEALEFVGLITGSLPHLSDMSI